jgi:hypothetical protein
LDPLEVAINVTCAVVLAFTLTELGETLQVMLVSDGVQERATVPLKPKTEARFSEVFAVPPFASTNCDTLGAMVKSGLATVSTTVNWIGELTDSW